ncbi:MAG: hypothetical protein F4X82_02015 [Candidatus Spechtbacteria bacterium SB0662_bin_43]|uniref:DUF5678 domain-containing protein n=1 Tax=Candidatus Spechtbacteria bacterium SB0662_bin_43 TaxID=2604897 RepID=A0A845DLS3_9BACT|nr:hypothetical protein [Candidatus Spechtbacteria bacterium SB0662_bin_43]
MNSTVQNKEKIDVAKENYKYFQDHKHEIQKEHAGKIVLMHKKGFIDYYDTREDAIAVGFERYGEGNFSIQDVDDKPANLGIFSIKFS